MTAEPSGSERGEPRPAPSGSDVTDAVRVQILSTEHGSLLATRTTTQNEIFSRATMFITVLSAAAVALALVAQAGGFGPEFRLFALLVLSVALIVGVATFIRLGDANSEDIRLVMAMNRLRYAYLEIAPELEPFFTTGHRDDHAGIQQTYGTGLRPTVGRLFAGTPALIGIINAVLAGVIGGLLGASVGLGGFGSIVVGIIVAIAAGAAESATVYRAVRAGRASHEPRFPSEGSGPEGNFA